MTRPSPTRVAGCRWQTLGQPAQPPKRGTTGRSRAPPGRATLPCMPSRRALCPAAHAAPRCAHPCHARCRSRPRLRAELPAPMYAAIDAAHAVRMAASWCAALRTAIHSAMGHCPEAGQEASAAAVQGPQRGSTLRHTSSLNTPLSKRESAGLFVQPGGAACRSTRWAAAVRVSGAELARPLRPASAACRVLRPRLEPAHAALWRPGAAVVEPAMWR